MKLTLWQQFSGNHSSSFTVVGEFPTHEDAVRAADEVRRILKRLKTWHTKNASKMQDWWNSGEWSHTNSPIEDELATQYNIPWEGAIDWYDSAKVEIVLDRLVFITPKQRPEADGKPFEQIMTSLGGKGYHAGDVYGEDTGWILFDITCLAPDEKTAKALYRKYRGFNRRITREGAHLHFDRWQFDEAQISFAALITALQKQGCIQIEYTFTQFDPRTDSLQRYTADDIDELVELLTRDKDNFDQNEIVDVLSQFDDPRIIAPFIEMLTASDVFVQRKAALQLGRFGNPQAVEPLLHTLATSRDISLVLPAIVEALGAIGDSRAVEPLITLLNANTDALRQGIARRLGSLGPLINKEVFWPVVANALGQIGEPSQDAITQALESGAEAERTRLDIARQRVDDTIKGGAILAGLRSLSASARERAFKDLIEADDREIMFAYLRNSNLSMTLDSDLQARILKVLVENNDLRVIPIIKERILVMGRDGFNALKELGAPAVPTLIEMVKTSEYPLNQDAFSILTFMEDPQALDLFIDVLTSSAPMMQMMHQMAIWGLGRIKGARGIQALKEACFVALDQGAGDKAQALFEAMKAAGASTELNEMVTPLLERFQHNNPMTQWTILSLLGQIGDRRAIAPLRAFSTTDARLQALIQDTLRRLGA